MATNSYNVRLKLPRESREIMERLNRSLHFSSYAVLLRYAMSLAIAQPDRGKVKANNDGSTGGGFEISRATLFGGLEPLYKYAYLGDAADDYSDSYFFPKTVSELIERGLRIMDSEYKFAGSKTRFLKNIAGKIKA